MTEMTEWIAIIKDLGMLGALVLGIYIAKKGFNGSGDKEERAPARCPAEEVLDQYGKKLDEAKIVQEGLIEGLRRNTTAVERQTDILARR